MPRIRLSAALLGATIAFGSSCASRADTERLSAPDGHWCGTRAVLVVRNMSGGEVEIVEDSGSGGGAVIAVVGEGTHELDIRGENGYSYFARRLMGSGDIRAFGHRRARDVVLDRECRIS